MNNKRDLDKLIVSAARRTKERDYWVDKLSGKPVKSSFPVDFKKVHPKKEFSGKVDFHLSGELSTKLVTLSAGSDVRLYVALTAALTLLLYRYTDSDDIIIGSPVLKPESESEFINTVLILRNFINSEITFKEFLLQVKGTVAEAQENCSYPIEILAEQLDMTVVEGDFPLSDVALLLQNIHNREHISHLKWNVVFSFIRESGRIAGQLEYNRSLYKSATIGRLPEHFKNLLQVVLSNPGIALKNVDILSPGEKQKLLIEFNDTAAAYPENKTVHELFAEQAACTPDQVALFAGESEGKNGLMSSGVSLTYRQMLEESGRLAVFLKNKGVGSGSIVGVIMERSINMVIGIFAVLTAGGAYLPILPGYPDERKRYILKDSAAKIVLSARGVFENPGIPGVETVYIDEKIDNARTRDAVSEPCGRESIRQTHETGHIAYIIYTSGSTGKPKGVVVRHSSLVNILTDLQKKYPLDGADAYLFKTSYVFDVSLAELFGWFFAGGRLVILEKGGEKDPKKIIAAIESGGVTHVNFVPSMFNVFIDELNVRNIGRLSGLKYIFLAGEALQPESVKRFARFHSGIVLENIYGPTEGTIYSSYFSLSRWQDGDVIPIGKPMQNTGLFIFSREELLQPIGVPGELNIAGAGLACGYLNRPELTAEKFIRWVGSEVFYKTGDRARRLPDGNIEYLGRIDFQVKIRGFRIELGEIESRLLKYEKIKEAVLVAKEDSSGEKYLCAYIVLNNSGPEEEAVDRGGVVSADLRLFLSLTLPDYMIPSYFIFLEKMPVTPNGKIDRSSLPDPRFGVSGEKYAAPKSETQQKLVKIWTLVLGINPTDTKLGIDDNFFEMGGHSLKATTLVNKIYREFGIDMEINEVFSNPTIREMARRIEQLDTCDYVEITPVEKKEYYELSYAQRRLWVLCQFEEDSTAYNMPSAFTVTGSFDVPAFARAVRTLSRRHDSLRTVFIPVDGAPRQRIIDARDFIPDFKEIDLTGLTEEAKEREARDIYMQVANRAFNLEQGPLFRFRALRLQREKYLLFFNIHHIVNDGWSQGNIDNEIVISYNSFLNKKENPLSYLFLQYKDYTIWHNNLIRSGSFSKSREYWLEKFRDRPNGLDLPLDHSRKPIQTFNGGRVSFAIDPGQTSGLYKLSLAQDVTLFMSLLCLLNIFLSKYTGQPDIIIGAPIAARKRPELYPVVGFLVNTLVYRSRVSPDDSFIDLLSAVKNETLTCYEHQDYPFDLMVEELGLDRDLSQSPVFNVMLAHNNADTENIDLRMEGITISDYAYREDFNMSKFDLIFFMDEWDDSVSVRIEFNSDLFERRTIERLADNFHVLVNDVLRHKELPVSGLNYIGDAEYERIIRVFNDNRYEFPVCDLQDMLENRAGQVPGKTAVVGIAPLPGHPGGENCPAVSYGDLNGRANRLAHYLREEYRVGANDVIGISMDRSIDMIIVLLAVVKSGAGYLAVDPTYPRERVLHVLSDSEAKLLIIDKMRPELFADFKGEIVDIKFRRENIAERSPENPAVSHHPLDILYVNYTSGSTGTPNGAMLSHDCLTNLINWQHEKTSIDCSLRVLQFTSINFCVSFQEIMGTLTGGGELHLIGDIERQDIDYLLDFLAGHQIEILFLPFSYLNFLFNESGRWHRSFKHSLKHIITAGEQLKITAGLKRFLDANTELQLHNHYGSTEMHVVTSYTLAAATAGQTPIPPAGKPVNNVNIYILDENLNPAAIGVWGEIFVKGSTEILGYINNKALTAEKLVKHPQFSSDGVRLYRSGDIGRWHSDGNIELRGRKDFQVKIRGFRVEPGEIESKILAIGNVRECVVVVKEDKNGQKSLVAYVVLEEIELSRVKKILGEDLPQYMLPQLVVLKHLPLMPNGKVDRDNLPEPEFEKKEEYTAPRDRLEASLTDIWAEILAMEKDHISIDDNFFELGGHSLKATLMVSKIQQKAGRRIPLSEIFKTPTIRELAGYIRAARAEEFAALKPAKDKDYYVLSTAQRRLFILFELESDTTGYNMPVVLSLAGELDRTRLADTFRKLISRHESLRTSFHRIDDEAFQQVHDALVVEFEIEFYRAGSSLEAAGIIDRFIRPFDLSCAPLLRAGLIPLEDRRFILMVDMHHIISDGTSLGILTRDYMALYAGSELPALPVHYKDFSEWQNSPAEKERIGKQGEYWLKQFAGEIPVLKLPCDYPRPPLKSSEGATLFFEINKTQAAALKELALEREATLFMVLLAIYCIFLRKLSGQEDTVVGTPVAGRRHVDLEPLIGMFVNTLSIRSYPENDKCYGDYLQEVKMQTLEAFENQDYPFEDLVEKLDLKRDTSRSPLFDVMFALQNMEVKEVEIPGLKLSPYEYESKTAKFDLVLMGFEVQTGMLFSLEYSSKLFKKSTIERFVEYFKNIITVVLGDHDIRLSDINIANDLISPEVDISHEIEGDFGF